MTIIINKQGPNEYHAYVADIVTTYFAWHKMNNFDAFKNGITASGKTWYEAISNITKSINEYISIYQQVMGEDPHFMKNNTTIINENIPYNELTNA